MSKGGVRYSKERALRPAHQFPLGSVWLHAGTTPPPGCFECDGRAVSRTTYKALFDEIGTVHGAGDGSTTFNIPDLRGVFVRGWDHGRGKDPSRAAGSSQDDAFQGHWHDLYAYAEDGAAGGGASRFENASSATSFVTAANVKNPVTDGINGTPRTAGETRPKNVALMYVIKHTYIPGYDPEVGGANAATLEGFRAGDFATAGHITHLGEDVSKMTNGYKKFADGLIIQWGGPATGAITFPLAFPTACLNVTVGGTSGNQTNERVVSVSTTGFTLGGVGYWMAIGY
jgi:microcystin-dependent protein